MKNAALFLAWILTAGCFYAHAETLNYRSNGQEFEGFILASKNKNAPALLIVHNWMGITDETKHQALNTAQMILTFQQQISLHLKAR